MSSEISESNQKLIYWLLFDFYSLTESVTRQEIGKHFCSHFPDKTEEDIDGAIKFLTDEKLIIETNKEKEIYRITAKGGQVVTKLLNQFVIDEIDYKFFLRYINNVSANYPKQYQREFLDEKDTFTRKLKTALNNIHDFYEYMKMMKNFPYVHDLFDILSNWKS